LNTNQVFCYGEIGIDNIIRVPHLPAPELAAFPTGDSYHIGGAAANTAVWLAGLGVRVGLSGNHIGWDEYGTDLWKRLSAHPNLDLEHVTRAPGTTTPFCRVMVTPDAERTFLVYWYPGAPKTEMRPAMLRGARFLALDLYGGEERLEAAKLGNLAGVTTAVGDVIDPAHPVLPYTGIATNSAAYIRAIHPGADVRELARRLREVSGGIVITTDGRNLVHAIDRDGAEFTVRPPVVTAVDATGAGDAFRSGLLAGLVRGLDLRTSVCWGAAAGALKVQRVGAATEVPALEEVVELASNLSVEET
jgi:sugar/nucleoside kinase (ribokinase family)